MTLTAWEAAARAFEPKPDLARDPVSWSRDRLREYWWGKQREIARSLVENRYTAVQSCHDAGKSFVASRLTTHWIDTHDVGEAFAVTTAPTAAQVEAILWREIGKAHRKAGLDGRILGGGFPQWKYGTELVAYGRKPADYDQAAFQGIHARFVLVVIDEACGVPKGLFDAADALATNEHARVLAIGNPDDPTSHFASICKPGSGWNVIRIDGLRTPNFTEKEVASGRYPLLERLMREEGVPFSTEQVPESLREMLLSPLWVEERLARWVGKPDETTTLSQRAARSSLFTAKVRGLFPSADSEGVIPLGWVERAIDRYHDWVARGRPDLPGRRVIGTDVAGDGEDSTCLAIRQGRAILELRRFAQGDTMETAGHVQAALNAEPHSKAIVDAIGIGAGVADRLREDGSNVLAFTASAKSTATDRSGEFSFLNARAAAWWNLREMLDPSYGSDLMLPDDELLKADLTTPKWKVRSGAKIQIESKDEIRKRLGRSTDAGDAVVQAFNTSAAPVDGEYAPGSGTVPWDDPTAPDAISWKV